MLIQPIKTHNQNRHMPVFTANPTFVLRREVMLPLDSVKQLSTISERYSRILQNISKLSFKYQTKFKASYPNLVSGEKIQGFVFESILGLKNKRLQVVKYKHSHKQDELITFNVLDDKNRKLLNCRVTKDGMATLTSEQNNVEALSNNPFAKGSSIEHPNHLDTISSEFEALETYSENLNFVRKKIAQTDSAETTVRNIISKAAKLKGSVGLPEEIYQLLGKYTEAANVFKSCDRRVANAIKKEFFGDKISHKGLLFDKIDNTNRSYGVNPLKRSSDNAVFKITVRDEQGILENNFVFFADGKVAKQRKLSENPDHLRIDYLEYLSDEEIENLNISKIINGVNKKLDEYRKFIVEKRTTRSILQEAKSAKSAENRAELAERKRIQREKTLAQKIRNEKILKQKLAKKEERERIKAQKAQVEALRKARVEKAKEKRYQKKLKLINQPATEIKPQQIQEIKPTIVEIAQINMTQIIKDLDNIFKTPVEKRSPHLIHERLKNGNIFNGRFSMNASDGAEVTVSRVKSPKDMTFIYYSIKVKGQDCEYVMNVDPDYGKIILSKDGKPYIDHKGMIYHLSKEEFLKMTPEAKDLPRYLSELTEQRPDAERIIIDSKAKIASKQKRHNIEIQEREILKILSEADDSGLIFMNTI